MNSHVTLTLSDLLNQIVSDIGEEEFAEAERILGSGILAGLYGLSLMDNQRKPAFVEFCRVAQLNTNSAQGLRIRAINKMRQAKNPEPSVTRVKTYGHFDVDVMRDTRTQPLRFTGTSVYLSLRETDLLALVYKHAGRYLPYDEITSELYHETPRTVSLGGNLANKLFNRFIAAFGAEETATFLRKDRGLGLCLIKPGQEFPSSEPPVVGFYDGTGFKLDIVWVVQQPAARFVGTNVYITQRTFMLLFHLDQNKNRWLDRPELMAAIGAGGKSGTAVLSREITNLECALAEAMGTEKAAKFFMRDRRTGMVRFAGNTQTPAASHSMRHIP